MTAKELKHLQQQLRQAIRELPSPEADAVAQQLIDADVKIGQAVRGMASRERKAE